jgi:hypothetical protein
MSRTCFQNSSTDQLKNVAHMVPKFVNRSNEKCRARTYRSIEKCRARGSKIRQQINSAPPLMIEPPFVEPRLIEPLFVERRLIEPPFVERRLIEPPIRRIIY